jgi:5-hydroxyisourate hydrolase-like protein (transthyretin family)
VNITITVIDGVSGHPADGVEVAVVGRPIGEEVRCLEGRTDIQGNFTYSPESERLSKGEYYTVELDVDAYFASLGLVAGYKQVTILVRVLNTQSDYRIGTLITPFAHASWSAR